MSRLLLIAIQLKLNIFNRNFGVNDDIYLYTFDGVVKLRTKNWFRDWLQAKVDAKKKAKL